MNKASPRIRQYRVKLPASTRQSQQITHEFELLFSPKYRNTSPKHANRVKITHRKDCLPSLKERIQRASSIV